MSEIHLLRPWWLLALLPLAGIVVLLLRQGRSGGAWQDHVDPALLPYVLAGNLSRATRWPAALAGLVGSLAVLALAGPAFERLPAPVFRSLSALVVVLDLSPAMEATDVKPSRIDQARFKIDDILRARKDGQSALVVYAGDAFTVTPLTDDAATIAAQLGALSPRLMPVQGTRADLGLDRAAQLLGQAGVRSGDVLLVTSGDGLEGAEAAAERLRKAGYRLSVLGVGTPEGAPIPLPEGGFAKDSRGGIAVPRLDRMALKRLAETGGGVYRTLEPGFSDLSTLLRFLDRHGDTAGPAGATVKVEQWREAGIWLLPLLLPLAALAFRRGWLGAWLILALLPAPRPAAAFEWADLWQTPNQRAQQEFRAGDAGAAAQRFQDPAWKAAAEYKAGDFEAAAKELEHQDTGPGQYNRGNALARAGKLEDALKAYDRALKLRPNDPDTVHNRKLVDEALKKQQEQQKDDQKQQGQDQGQQQQESQSKPKDGQNQGEQESGKKNPQQQNQESGEQDAAQQNPQGNEDREASGQPQDGNGKEKSPQPEPGPKQDAAERKPEEGQRPGEQRQAEQGREQPAPGEPAEAGERADGKPVGSAAERADETRQSEEQWLRRIPDDPGGLLKRKFYYQYKQRQQQQESERNPW